jgi:DNA-directed RNA polymerase specialized sigma24 family protein
VERFFNKTPCKDIAERFDVKENTIVRMYAMAVKQLEQIIERLDARKAGIKAMAPDKFKEDEKWFMLHAVFGFTQNEIAEMFGKNRNLVGKRVKRMSDKYLGLFQEPEAMP